MYSAIWHPCIRWNLLSSCSFLHAIFLKTFHLLFWQNLKMKISHPRFLIIGNQENMKLEFPACLTKKTDSVQSDAHANPNIMSDTVFSFPEVSVESSWCKLCITTLISADILNWSHELKFVSGHFCSRWNTLLVASLVQGCCSRWYFSIHERILWDWRYIKCH